MPRFTDHILVTVGRLATITIVIAASRIGFMRFIDVLPDMSNTGLDLVVSMNRALVGRMHALTMLEFHPIRGTVSPSY
jgi:hypothetical protein